MQITMNHNFDKKDVSSGLWREQKSSELVIFFVNQKASIQKHQLFDYKITYVISQHDNTNSKSDFVLKTSFKRSF